MKDIAICVIGYNRLASIKRILDSLDNAVYPHTVKLYISIDKSNTTVVEEYAQSFQWKHGSKEVLTHPENLGLKKHVLKCGSLLDNHDALIVLEDDVVVSPGFFYYSESCVEKFCDDDRIAGIGLYSFPVNFYTKDPFIPMNSHSDIYLLQSAVSWGQVWMKRQWFDFIDWYSKNEEFVHNMCIPSQLFDWGKKSWLKYHIRYCIETNKFFVYPYKSLSTCFSDIGEHTGTSSSYLQTNILNDVSFNYNLDATIAYDAFFESLLLSETLNIPQENLIVDFYGQKSKPVSEQYLVSCEKLPYKVVKSYGLVMKPYERNIINNIIGNELFLYDTTIPACNKNGNNYSKKFFFLYNTRMNSLGILNCYITKFKTIIKKFIR